MILFLFGMVLAAPSAAQDSRDSEIPWGVSSSSSSFRNSSEWLPKMSAAGVRTVRLFPEWGGLQPTPESWTWGPTDAMVKSAATQKIEIDAILMGMPASPRCGASTSACAPSSR